MHTNFDSSSYASYSQTQSFNSDSHSDAFHGNTVVNRQTTESSYSQQYSRSQNGMSMSQSTTSFHQTTEKGRPDKSSGFAGTHHHRESVNTDYRRDDRSGRFCNRQNDRWNSEFHNQDNGSHCCAQKNDRWNNGFGNHDNGNRWCGQKNDQWNNGFGHEQQHFSSQKTESSHTHVDSNKNTGGDRQNGWSNTEIDIKHSSSNGHNAEYEHTHIDINKNNGGDRQNGWSNTEVDIKHSQSSNQHTESSNSQVHVDKNQGHAQQTDWTNTKVQNNQSSIDLGDYDLDLNKSDSSISLKNEKTGDTTKIWGDPHITTGGTTGMFKGSMTFELPDQTKVTVGTQAKGAVSYADQVTITKGNDAYVVNGLSQLDSNALTVERSNNGRQLDQMTPDGFKLAANKSGTGWINPQTGKAPTTADFSKA